MVVDDNEFNLYSLREILSNYFALESDFAVNGQVAVEKFKQSQACCPHRLIFMDLSMPVMDGFEATRQIWDLIEQRDPGANIEDPVSCAGSVTTPQTRIYALTANTTDHDRKRCKKLGMIFMPKPAVFENVKKVLLTEFGDELRIIEPPDVVRKTKR